MRPRWGVIYKYTRVESEGEGAEEEPKVNKVLMNRFYVRDGDV